MHECRVAASMHFIYIDIYTFLMFIGDRYIPIVGIKSRDTQGTLNKYLPPHCSRHSTCLGIAPVMALLDLIYYPN